MKLNIGFIGCGKMASAIINGVLCSKNKDLYNIKRAEINDEVAASASKRLGIEVTSNSKELVKASDIIFIATKYLTQIVKQSRFTMVITTVV